MADSNYIRSLFLKFLADECTSEEIEQIINYLQTATGADDLPEVEEVKAKLGPLPKLDDHRADLIFDNIINSDRRLDQSRMRWWKMAAAITGILLISGVLFLTQFQASSYATTFGETKHIILPDGSEVTLNANSELQLAEVWEEGTAREVWLEGEAFERRSYERR